jgi:hypothetical protein
MPGHVAIFEGVNALTMQPIGAKGISLSLPARGIPGAIRTGERSP